MIDKRIYVGVSGGIDSAATLVVLKEQGFEVTGVYLFMRGAVVEESTRKQLDEISKKTGVEILIHDVREKFQKCVVDPFIEGYLAGETPSPCTDCNPQIKWSSLLEVADRNGGGMVATGHYCRVVEQNGHYYLAKGCDPLKDQSYYMWQLPQSVLSRAVFPLGEMTKSEVREFMRQHDWEVMVEKRESMGICFLEGKKYAQWLEKFITLPVGEVVNGKGDVIGSHRGYPFYTLAQKKGFTLFHGEHGLAVVEIDCARNRLVVGESQSLQSNVLYLKKWQFVSLDELFTEPCLEVKVRGVGENPSGYCKVTQEGELMKVTLCDDTAWAVTKGQPVVFYVNERLIGGGIVERCQITN